MLSLARLLPQHCHSTYVDTCWTEEEGVWFCCLFPHLIHFLLDFDCIAPLITIHSHTIISRTTHATTQFRFRFFSAPRPSLQLRFFRRGFGVSRSLFFFFFFFQGSSSPSPIQQVFSFWRKRRRWQTIASCSNSSFQSRA